MGFMVRFEAGTKTEFTTAGAGKEGRQRWAGGKKLKMLVPALKLRKRRRVHKTVTERAHLMKVGISDPTQTPNIH